MSGRKWMGAVVALVFAAGLHLSAQPPPQPSKPEAATQVKAGSTIDDATLDSRIEGRIRAHTALKDRNIEVDVLDGIATLKGHVRSNAEKAQAERLARIRGVTKVNNQLEVEPARATTGRDRDVGEKAKDAMQPLSDGWITTKIKAKFVPENALEGSNINVDTQNGFVTLSGTVPTEASRSRAVAIAKETEGVKNVRDNLTIGPKSKEREPGAVSRSERESDQPLSDTWITTKIKGQLVGEDVLAGSDITVETNNGVVMLSGTVPSAAARLRAVAIAKATNGVKSVKDNMTIGKKS